nr:reverse transcriptase domain-containing protein [Tanacetum cinerariifolium]
MVQPWQRVTRQKVTQSFFANQEISFPPLASNCGQESPMVIEAEVGGHLIHRIKIAEAPAEFPPNEPTTEKGVKMAIHPKSNLDVFRWRPVDMKEVSRSIAEHHLNVREGCSPIRQKNKGQSPYQSKAIQEEVAKLVEAHIMRELHYHSWLSNLVMSHTEQEIFRDIKENFQTLRRINMKVNTKKCTFEADEGMFLGHVVNMKGIKACLEKAKAVLKLQSLRTLKEVQSLNGKLESLSRFLSKSAEKSLPFFKTLKNCKKESDFLWTTKAEKAFQEMKQHIDELLIFNGTKAKRRIDNVPLCS